MFELNGIEFELNNLNCEANVEIVLCCFRAQVVGWPPVRSYRKNAMKKSESDGSGMFVKVSMDGAPYLRKIDLKFYNGYFDLLKALETMFKCTIGIKSCTFSGKFFTFFS